MEKTYNVLWINKDSKFLAYVKLKKDQIFWMIPRVINMLQLSAFMSGKTKT